MTNDNVYKLVIELRKLEEQLLKVPCDFLQSCSKYTMTTFLHQNLQNIINLKIILLFSIKKYDKYEDFIQRHENMFYSNKMFWKNFGTDTIWEFLFKKKNPQMSQKYLKRFTIKKVTKPAKKDLLNKIRRLNLPKTLAYQKEQLYNFILELAKELYIARELLWLEE